jgi:hypothetical protein
MFALDPANIGLPSQTDQPAMAVVKQFFPLPVPTLQFVNNNQFRFNAPQGFVYQPQTSTDLSSGNWTSYGSSFMGSGVTTNITMQVGPGSQGFYRVQVNHAP